MDVRPIEDQGSPNGGPGAIFIPLIALLWGAVIFSAYYVVHKPMAPEQMVAVGRVVLTLLGWIGTLNLANLIGRLFTPWLATSSPGDRLALRLGVGLGLLALFTLLLGALRLYVRPLAWLAVALALPFGLPGWLSEVRKAVPKRPTDLGERALAGYVVFTLGLAAVIALTPPTAWDSLVYHLTGPKLYLESGRLVHDLDLPYLGFPQMGSMLFTWGLMLSGPALAQGMHLTFALLTLALLPSLTRSILPRRSWFAVALALSVPSAILLASWAYVEWMTAFAGLASFRLLLAEDPELPSRRDESLGDGDETAKRSPWMRLALAGFFASMALGAKYTSLGLVVGLTFFLVVDRRSIRATAVFIAAALLFTLPYLVKNVLLTGNPVSPFFSPGRYWDHYRAIWFSRPGTGLNFIQLLVAPWEATVWGLEGGVVEGHPSYAFTAGPMLLSMVPFAVLHLKKPRRGARRALTGIILVCTAAYLIWLAELAFSALLVQTRLLFPILPLVAVLAAVGFDSLGDLGKRGASVRFVFGGLVGFALLLTGFESLVRFVEVSPLPVLFGFEGEGDFLVRRLGQYARVIERVNELPSGSRVRFLWEPRSYHCARTVTCEPDALLDRWWHLRQLGVSPDEVARNWEREGVSHVLIFHAGAQAVRTAGTDPFVREDWEALEAFIERQLVLLPGSTEAYGLYALRPTTDVQEARAIFSELQ